MSLRPATGLAFAQRGASLLRPLSLSRGRAALRVYATMGSGGDSSLEWPVKRVRSAFVDFFVSKGHTAVASSLVVPVNDPTLLFRCGMGEGRPGNLGMSAPRGDPQTGQV